MLASLHRDPCLARTASLQDNEEIRTREATFQCAALHPRLAPVLGPHRVPARAPAPPRAAYWRWGTASMSTASRIPYLPCLARIASLARPRRQRTQHLFYAPGRLARPAGPRVARSVLASAGSPPFRRRRRPPFLPISASPFSTNARAPRRCRAASAANTASRACPVGGVVRCGWAGWGCGGTGNP